MFQKDKRRYIPSLLCLNALIYKGMVTTVAKRPKIEDAQFWDLTIDNNQNLYITIKELGLIQKITKQGGKIHCNQFLITQTFYRK